MRALFMEPGAFWLVYGCACFVAVYALGRFVERRGARRRYDQIARELGFGSAEEMHALFRVPAGSVAGVEARALLFARSLVSAHDVQTRRGAPGVVDVVVSVAWWRAWPRREARWSELREAVEELLPAAVVVGRFQRRLTLFARREVRRA